MGRLTEVPGWVRPPHRDVRAAEHITLVQYGETKAPASLGAWEALTWLGEAPSEPTPITKLYRDPTERAARADMNVAGHLIGGDPYPDHPAWWEKLGIDYSEMMDAGTWGRWIRSGHDCDFALGVVAAYGWLVGVFDHPSCMVPPRYGDGTHIPTHHRNRLTVALARLDYTDEERYGGAATEPRAAS